MKNEALFGTFLIAGVGLLCYINLPISDTVFPFCKEMALGTCTDTELAFGRLGYYEFIKSRYFSPIAVKVIEFIFTILITKYVVTFAILGSPWKAALPLAKWLLVLNMILNPISETVFIETFASGANLYWIIFILQIILVLEYHFMYRIFEYMHSHNYLPATISRVRTVMVVVITSILCLIPSYRLCATVFIFLNWST